MEVEASATPGPPTPIPVVTTDLGLTRFQEMWAWIVCVFLLVVIIVLVLVRSASRRSTLQATRRVPLSVLTAGVTQGEKAQNKIAEESLAICQDFNRPFIPYTGRRVRGLINTDPDAERDEGLMQHNEQYDQWLDFREYARFVATVIRSEACKLVEEGQLSPFGAVDSLMLRDVLDHLLVECENNPKLLPDFVATDDDTQWRVAEAVTWLCDNYDRWRWGFRSGGRTATGERLSSCQTEVEREEVLVFRAIAEALIRHLQLLTPRCVICDNHRPNVRLLPCDHVLVCAGCAAKATDSTREPFLCPRCLVEVVTTEPVRSSKSTLSSTGM